MRNLLIIGIALSVLSASTVLATAATTAPASGSAAAGTMTPKPMASTTATAKSRTAISIECSKQADAKGLHAKERKLFRAKCRKDLMK